jgi:tetratricopeptide (TPR) repeat protein
MFWRCLVFCLVVCLSAHSFENDEHAVSELYQKWLALQVQIQIDEPLPKLVSLANQAEMLTKQHPLVPDCWALQGMIKAQQASLVSGLEGLKLAKQAKDMLQNALSLDPYVFYGVAYAELGWLYHRTPGWPFSFGSDKMAKHLFDKAVNINPRSIAANFRYAEYWFDQKDYAQAETFYKATLKAIKLQSPTELYNQDWSEHKKRLADQMLVNIHSKNSYLSNHSLSN